MDYNTLRMIVRELGHQLVPALRRAKRLHKAIEARNITAFDLLKTRVFVPEGAQLLSDGVVKDADGKIIADYGKELQECHYLLSALTGLRAISAILENDREFVQRGVTGIDWLYPLEMFMDISEIGGL